MGKNTREGRRSYTTRNMRADLLRRMKIIALHTEISTEEVLNRVLGLGLPVLERELKKEDENGRSPSNRFESIIGGANEESHQEATI